MMKWLLSFLLLIVNSYGGNLGVMTGYFSLDSKSSKASNKVSSVGSYRFFYHHEVRPNLTADLSYTILFEKGIGGDSSYGFDIGLNYFPFSSSSSTSKKIDNVQIKVEPKYSPFFGVGYHQRQYQSISTAYSGPGLKGGTTYSYNKNLNLIGEARYILLSGPSDAEAVETSLSIGIIVKY